MAYKTTRVKVLQASIAAVFNFIGIMTIWWLVMPPNFEESVSLYTVSFFAVTTLFFSTRWLASGILKLLRIEDTEKQKRDVVENSEAMQDRTKGPN